MHCFGLCQALSGSGLRWYSILALSLRLECLPPRARHNACRTTGSLAKISGRSARSPQTTRFRSVQRSPLPGPLPSTECSRPFPLNRGRPRLRSRYSLRRAVAARRQRLHLVRAQMLPNPGLFRLRARPVLAQQPDAVPLQRRVGELLLVARAAEVGPPLPLRSRHPPWQPHRRSDQAQATQRLPQAGVIHLPCRLLSRRQPLAQHPTHAQGQRADEGGRACRRSSGFRCGA